MTTEPLSEQLERLAKANLEAQMEAQADDTTPSSVQRDKGLVWLEGWFDLASMIEALRAKEGE